MFRHTPIIFLIALCLAPRAFAKKEAAKAESTTPVVKLYEIMQPDSSIVRYTADEYISFLLSENANLNKKISEQRQEIVKLQNAGAAAQKVLRDNEALLSEKDEEIAANQALLEAAEERSNEYDDVLVQIAQNQLLLPFDEFYVNKIAVPLSNRIKNPMKQDQIKPVVNLLKSYKQHIGEYIEFLDKMSNMYRTRPTIGRLTTDQVQEAFNSLECVKQYMAYPNWEYTYLGRIMLDTKSQLDINRSNNKVAEDFLKSDIDNLRAQISK